MAIVNGVVVNDTSDPLHNPSTYKVAERSKLNRSTAPIPTKYNLVGNNNGVDVYEEKHMIDPIEFKSTRILGCSQAQEQDVYRSASEQITIE